MAAWGWRIHPYPGGCSKGRVIQRSLVVATDVARLRLLDGFELSCNGEPVRLPLTAQRLLAYLALQDRPHSRMRVAFSLWPGASEPHAYGSLRSALHRLQASGYPLATVMMGELALGAEVSVDIHERLALVERLLAGESDDAELELGLVLLGGELLPDWFDDWALLERERYRELRLRALETICERELRAGRPGRAVRAGKAAVLVEPLRDSARRALIRARLAEGNKAEALAEYRDFARELHDRLGLQPSGEMTGLVRDLGVPLP